jgi:hypothetical protein
VIAPSMSLERMVERGKALAALEDAGVDASALIDLDRNVRAGLVTDWPGRPGGPEPRWPWEVATLCARCGDDDPGACGCWLRLLAAAAGRIVE